MPIANQASFDDDVMRLRFFPKPFDDELLYSVLCRYYVLCRPPGTWTVMLEDLLGKSNFETSGAYLQGRIVTLSRQLPEGHALADPIQAAFRHTALNYCTYFHKAWQRDDTAKRLVYGESVGQLFIFLGLRGSSLARPRPLRYCEACAREDFERVGTPYWHLSHHLPGVFVCGTHGRPLVHGCIACHEYFQSRKGVRLPPVEPCGIEGHRTSTIDIPFENYPRQLQELAVAARDMTMNPTGFPARWRTAVRAALTEDGFARGSTLKVEAITQALVDRFGQAMVTWCGFKRSADYVSNTSTVGRMLANTRYRHNSFRQLMVTMLLGPTLEAVEHRLKSMPGALDLDDEGPETRYEDDDDVCRMFSLEMPGLGEASPPAKKRRVRLGGTATANKDQQAFDVFAPDKWLRGSASEERQGGLPACPDEHADQESADRVLKTAADILRLSPKLQITRTLIRRYAKLPASVRMNPRQWPLTNRALNKVIEDQVNFVERRVRSALEQLSTKKQAIYLNDLAAFYQVPAELKESIREQLPTLCQQYGMEYLSK